MRPAALVATLFLALVAVGHTFRLVARAPITAAGVDVPLWASFLAAVGCGALAVWLWWEQRK